MESIPHRIILNMFLLNNAHGHPHGQSVHQEIFHINNSYAWTFAWTLCPCKNCIDEYFFDNINNINMMSMYYHFGFPHKKAQRHLANMGSKELVSLTGRGRSAVYAYNDVDADKGHDKGHGVPYRKERSKADTGKGHSKGQHVLNKQKTQQKKSKK